MQTCVLKVNIHCEGCKHKVKKILQKIEGVYAAEVDAETGRVTVTGNVDPATVIKKLGKSGKLAVLCGAPKGGGGGGGGGRGFNLNNQFQKLNLPDLKGGKPSKWPVAAASGNGGGGRKDLRQPALPQKHQLVQQQNKGFKDLKLPFLKFLPFQKKGQKSAKLCLPHGDGSDYDYDDDDLDDDDEEDFADLDGLGGGGYDFNGGPSSKMKHMSFAPQGGKKGGSAINGGIAAKFKGGGGNGGAANDGKNGKGGGGKKGWAGKNGGGGGNFNNGGNSGGNCSNPCNNNPSNGGGPKKKGGTKNNNAGVGSHGGFPAMDHMGQIGGVHHPSMANGGGFGGVPYSAMPQGYNFHGGASAGGANPYLQQQQQYMAAMFQQQQQQQRMMMMNGGGGGGGGGYDRMYPYMPRPMGYPRPPPQMMQGGYMPAPMMPPMNGSYTGEAPYHMFDDENTNSCSIM